MAKGIDVSVWNGAIDFEKVKKSGIDFVIIRAGYGRVASQKDTCFERNYAAAKAAGLLVGAYWYSYADSVAAAHQEAKACIECIKGKKFDFPIYFDIEEQSQFNRGSVFCSNLVKAFCDDLEKAGYFAGFYTGRYAVMNYISKEVAARYAAWVAEWGPKLNYSGQRGMWQYSANGKVNGINGAVDMDESYVDYPTIIRKKGLNGYEASEAVPPPAEEKKTYTVQEGDTISSIAKAVGISVDDLAAKNDLLKVGQILNV